MNRINKSLLVLSLIIYLFLNNTSASAQNESSEWKFVSISDFTNVDVNFPEPKWDDALDYVLGQIKAEDPDFVLVAGDLVMGRWWRTKEQLEYMADIYYGAWKQRMEKHGLKFYVVPGDHELGDNPWYPNGDKNRRGMGTWDCAPLEFVPYFEQKFVEHFGMPMNGPDIMKGLTYSFIHKNTLIVGVDVFEKELMGEKGQNATLSDTQIQWLDSTLFTARTVDHSIVFAHTPILGPVRKKSSSGLMLTGGRQSKFWQIMKNHNVELYLCGEVHQMTCIEKDGIEQIAHGGLLGYNTDINYLVVTVTPSEMQCELKEIETLLEGNRLSQSAGNEPFEYVRIPPEIKREGFKTVGTMTVKKEGNKKLFINKTGYFIEDNNPQ